VGQGILKNGTFDVLDEGHILWHHRLKGEEPMKGASLVLILGLAVTWLALDQATTKPDKKPDTAADEAAIRRYSKLGPRVEGIQR
jgi:hypothetical protein